MHKARTRSMLRYHKVHEIDVQPVERRVQDDLLPDIAGMSFPDCLAERTRLLHEKNRAEQELVSAKRERDRNGVTVLGLRIQSFSNRLSLINQRIKAVQHDVEFDALKRAAFEILDDETWQRVIARKAELRQSMLAGAAS